jgi:hypothetical protein
VAYSSVLRNGAGRDAIPHNGSPAAEIAVYAKAVGLPERPGRGLLEATGEGAEPHLLLFPESGRHGVPPVITRATPSGSRRTVDA